MAWIWRCYGVHPYLEHRRDPGAAGHHAEPRPRVALVRQRHHGALEVERVADAQRADVLRHDPRVVALGDEAEVGYYEARMRFVFEVSAEPTHAFSLR
jgi:hypothetical protein